MSLPVFYFTSKKDNPKSNINLNIQSINNIPVIDFESESNINLNIDNKVYIMDLKYVLKFERNKEPIVDVTYNIRNKTPEIKETIESLVSFMSEFKTKINQDLLEETKKLDEINAEKERRQNELEEKQKMDEKRRILKDKKYRDLLKIQESFMISQYNDRIRREEQYDEEHIKLMEDINIKNVEIRKKNQKIIEEEEVYKKQHFNSKEIISYLKTELDDIESDTKELEDNNIENEKLQKIKDKYKVDIPDNTSITEDCLNIENEIYTHIKDIVSENPGMIYTNLIYIITELMKFIENFNTEGADKKQIIIQSIKKFLIDQNMNSEETDMILDTVCPELIDILLLVDKRKIIIRKKLNCFFPFCG